MTINKFQEFSNFYINNNLRPDGVQVKPSYILEEASNIFNLENNGYNFHNELVQVKFIQSVN